ncbi:peptidoglycan DD-metalloendopeptidase family protein [Paraherbaspirillum soli]|uniref:Peptidoglycan DD-metalloendopeptidase family protein n=1 Tax=Paraherbaspirillum soli TaxID=631222 RepID=A0ABW0MAI8_9BURK
MKKTRFIVLGIMVGTLAACTTPRSPAPVVERRPGGTGTATTGVTSDAPRAAEGRGYYTVKKGDTLYRIALEFGQSYRDIVVWNKLENANDIKVDQVLRVQPPDGSSANGAQVGNIAVNSGVEVRPLTSAPSSGNGSSSSNGGNKVAPRGDKRPYSESALAELQKPDSGPTVETPKANDKVVTPLVAPATTPAAAAGDEERVVWMWPAEGKQVGSFDQGKKGIDISGKSGQTVVAAASGKVMYAGSGIRGYGNLVIVKHTSNLLSAYAHNKTILVKEGQTVNKGQKIAEMGNSDSDAVKLHFEIRQQGKPVDPSKFLPNR